jgi:nitrogen fixation-related uncharacterized protein
VMERVLLLIAAVSLVVFAIAVVVFLFSEE